MKTFISETAESEVIGHIIILSITILGVSMLTISGLPAIYNLQDMANARNAEQAFTILDSRASRSTLGESPIQITNINLGGGSITVEPNSSFIFINSSSFNITIPMGRIKYTLGNRIVAYEGGGVWAQYPGGGTVMLSPPEFHYNGVTLTLPVINISGNASAGGKGTALVAFKKRKDENATIIHYPHPTIPGRTNPVNTTAGKVFVNIRSDYYLAWADYARSLGYTKVDTNSSTHTANIELKIVPSTLGANAHIPDPLTFRGLDSSDITPLENLSFKIKPLGTLNWDLRASIGNKKLIFHLKKEGGNYNLNIGYQDNLAETWEGSNLFTVQPDGYLYVDLLNKSINLQYDSETVGSTAPCTPGKIISGDFSNTDFSWDDLIIQKSPPKNATQSLYNITQHYFGKMAQEGDIAFSQCTTGGGGIDSGSTVLADYNTTGALTYLHITENIVDVEIN